MAIVTTIHRVRRWTRQDFTGFQVLERVTCVFGIQVWCRKLDK